MRLRRWPSDSERAEAATGRLARCGNHRNNPELLPEFGNGAGDRTLGHFPAQRVLELRNRSFAHFQKLVGLDGELRNLSGSSKLRRAAPVAVAAQSINVGQHPGGHDEVRLLARLAQQIQADSDIGVLKPHQQLLGLGDLPGIGRQVPMARNRLNKRRRQGYGVLPARRKQA